MRERGKGGGREEPVFWRNSKCLSGRCFIKGRRGGGGEGGREGGMGPGVCARRSSSSLQPCPFVIRCLSYCVCIQVHVCLWACVSVHICMYVYVCAYLSMCVCLCALGGKIN